MPKLKIDEVEYNTEDLTENGLAQLASLQFVEQQLRTIRSEIAVYQTAQKSYLTALKTEIEETGIQPINIVEAAEDGLDTTDND